MVKTGSLLYGGVMTTYLCNAACRHCLYSSSPARGEGFLDEKTALEIGGLLAKNGCRNVHIGGGEPFLDFQNLLMTVRALKSAGVEVDYVETNAFWALEDAGQNIREKLKALSKAGARCLCISLDPFHIEYVPHGAPLALAEACEKTGFDYFLWKGGFLHALSPLDPRKTHPRSELEKIFSGKFVYNAARSHGIVYGGRAVNIEREFAPPAEADFFLEAASAPCQGLLGAGHFHVDKNGWFIPPTCTGIKIPLREATEGIPQGKYEAFEALYTGGTGALFQLASRHGFKADLRGYPSKCNLCFHLRRYLAGTGGFPELDRAHYEEALKYY